jgi:hypothetical protein
LIQSLPVNVTNTVTIDLLSYYTSAEILGEINAGMLDMQYGDDAFVTYAEINLTNAIPEPASMLLVSGALAVLYVSRRRVHT